MAFGRGQSPGADGVREADGVGGGGRARPKAARSQLHYRSAAWMVSASLRPTPLTAHSSSTLAVLIALTLPKCWISSFLVLGPTPLMPSSDETSERLARRLRWWVIANRWASSRIRVSR